MNSNTPASTPFTDVYVQLLDTVRAMIPGVGPAKAVEEKKAEVDAKQEWEQEGGNVKPAPAAKVARAAKPAKAPRAKKAVAKRRPKQAKPASKKSARRVRARR